MLGFSTVYFLNERFQNPVATDWGFGLNWPRSAPRHEPSLEP